MTIRFICGGFALAVVSIYGCGGGSDIESTNQVDSAAADSGHTLEAQLSAKPFDNEVVVKPKEKSELVNGDFETGNLISWTVKIPWGISEFEPHDRPAGSVNVDESMPYGYYLPFGSPISTTFPKEGKYFLQILTGNDWFITSQTYEISASQLVRLRKGDTLAGFSFYYNGDYAVQDSVWVKIFDDTGIKLLATPWLEYSGGLSGSDPNSVPFLYKSNWTSWQWTAPKAGVYTLKLGASTAGDNRFGTGGYYDMIRVVPVEKGKPTFKEHNFQHHAPSVFKH